MNMDNEKRRFRIDKRFCINSTLKTFLLLRMTVYGLDFNKDDLPFTAYNISLLFDKSVNDKGFKLSYERISDDGFLRIILRTRCNAFYYNIISPFGNLLSPTWFSWCGVFDRSENFADVQRVDDYKCNWIGKDGSYLSSTWFDDFYPSFHEGFARVRMGGKWNFINHRGKLLSQEWFKECHDFVENCEFAVVERADVKNHLNIITKDGKLVSERWFSYIETRSDDGFYLIHDNNYFWNVVDSKGNLLKEKWFRKNIFSAAWGIILLRKKILINWLKNKFKRI